MARLNNVAGSLTGENEMIDYNGWTNRETWLVNVWFNPESESDVEFAKEQIEEAYESMPDFMRDFCDIGSIDWDELKQAVSENE
jgi:hypothetical protein